MKKINIVLIALASIVLLSMGNVVNAQTENSKKETSMDTSWKKITPEQIKDNPFTLISKDWMSLNAGTEGNFNTMTIAWGGFGYLWVKPVVTVYVSSSRYTHKFMENNDYFIVEAFPENMQDALMYIGTHSGRDGDKLTPAGLTASFTPLGNPILNEGRLIIECKKIYSAPFEENKIPAEAYNKFYKNGKNGIHTMYIGEIVNVWVK